MIYDKTRIHKDEELSNDQHLNQSDNDNSGIDEEEKSKKARKKRKKKKKILN